MKRQSYLYFTLKTSHNFATIIRSSSCCFLTIYVPFVLSLDHLPLNVIICSIHICILKDMDHSLSWRKGQRVRWLPCERIEFPWICSLGWFFYTGCQPTNRGGFPPKSSILIGFGTIIFTIHFGGGLYTPYFWKHPTEYRSVIFPIERWRFSAALPNLVLSNTSAWWTKGHLRLLFLLVSLGFLKTC